MKDRIRALSGRTEFLVVVIGAFGIFLPTNVLALLAPKTVLPHSVGSITNGYLNKLVLYELVILLCLGTFLRARGWTLQKIGLTPSVRDTLAGIALTLGGYAAHLAVLLPLLMVLPALAAAPQIATQLVRESLDINTILAVSVVNPIFEEVFVCAYIVTALKERRGVTLAVNVSTALRVTYHLYQGPLGVLGVAPIGLIFAYWYARTNRLWPVIVAHGAIDLIGLAYASGAAG
jgi:membrane protease YdiL (CAAX protease family)